MIKRYRSEFVEFVLEQMAFVQGLRIRTMFGGFGLYQDDHIFAIIVKDTLYLKSDAIIQRDFEEKYLQPFSYVAQGKSVTLRYFEAPPEVFEAPDSMRNWVEKALGASIRQSSPSPDKTFRERRGKSYSPEFFS